MENFKVVATADLWVYNAENFCVSFFNQVTSIFHLQGGKIKKKFFWAYLMYMIMTMGQSGHSEEDGQLWWRNLDACYRRNYSFRYCFHHHYYFTIHK